MCFIVDVILWKGTKCFRWSDLACVSLGDVVLPEGGKIISGRVILHVFYKGTLYCWRGTKYFR